MRVYLAGPINGCTDAEANDWRTEAKKRLTDIKAKFLDPMARDYRGKEDESVNDIVHGDKHDIDCCTHLLVYFEKPSVGTSMEVIYAWERGIPVGIINKSGKPLSPWLRYHSTFIKPSLKAAINWLPRVSWPKKGKSINKYTYSFTSQCLVNGFPIDYTLVIELDKRETIMVERLMRVVNKGPVLHEPLADELHRKFGGVQKLTAHHHGVTIETLRA